MKALAIFGSTARNEREFDSDIDMIGIYDNEKIKSITKSSVSLFLYPEKYLTEKMLTGDLFALHLVKESIPIYGGCVFDEIYSQFNYKLNYKEEMESSYFLAMEIIKMYQNLEEYKEANKKLAWCLRTMIISISAQNRSPVFSKKALSEYISIPSITPKTVLQLINIKNMSIQVPTPYIEILSFIFNNLFTLEKLTGLNKNSKMIKEMLHQVVSKNKLIDY